ncbi:MAG: phage tail protein [Pseudomonadota bacterium]
MRQKIIIAFALLAIVFALTTTHAASVPPLINYQGMLTDAQGQPLANGTKKLTFNIYDAATDGTLVWGPQVFDPVPVLAGLFNIILGTTDTSGRSIVDAFGTDSRFLGITVDEVGQTGGTEIVPRQQILSAPYAVQAEAAQNANLFANHPPQWFTPVGTIVAYWGATAPDGWLLCDGSTIETQYVNLIALVGSTVPDLRGVFLRGLDAGKSLDPNRVLGSYQADEFKSHTHRYHNQVGGDHNGYNPAGGWEGGDHDTGAAGGSETRPKNIAVNYIIKY